MNNQFINCPNCGIRNFLNDKVCGVCKTSLDKNLTPKKTNYLVLILILGGIFLLYYNFFRKESVVDNSIYKKDSTTHYENNLNYQSSSLQYEILQISLNNRRAFNVDVRITNKLSDDELKSLAQKVKSDINAVSEKGIVFFLLPEMKIDNGAWAKADFNPELNVHIIGQSSASGNSISNYKKNSNNKDFLGQWVDDYTSYDFVHRLRKDPKQGLLLELYSPSTNEIGPLPIMLKKSFRNGKTIFIHIESPDQYFQMENNGDLTVYDNNGYVQTYKKL